MKIIAPRYLGDAVYASFDGHHVCLHLNDHRSEPVVKLEQEVFEQLCSFVEDMQTALQEKAEYDQRQER